MPAQIWKKKNKTKKKKNKYNNNCARHEEVTTEFYHIKSQLNFRNIFVSLKDNSMIHT